MHEWTICKAIIKQLEQQATNKHFTQVKKIILKLGELSCIDPNVLSFNFSLASQQTVAEQAVLEFVTVASLAKCLACLQTYSANTIHTVCPMCGSVETQLIQGQELIIQSIEVEPCV